MGYLRLILKRLFLDGAKRNYFRKYLVDFYKDLFGENEKDV